jgi:hypothetical protein
MFGTNKINDPKCLHHNAFPRKVFQWDATVLWTKALLTKFCYGFRVGVTVVREFLSLFLASFVANVNTGSTGPEIT